MEIYRVTYRQLSPDKRDRLRDNKVEVVLPDSYEEWTRLVAIEGNDLAMIETTLRQYVTSGLDKSHWLIIDGVEFLGSALKRQSKEPNP